MVKIEVNRGVFDRENLALSGRLWLNERVLCWCSREGTSVSCGVAEAQSSVDLDDNGL